MKIINLFSFISNISVFYIAEFYLEVQIAENILNLLLNIDHMVGGDCSWDEVFQVYQYSAAYNIHYD